MSFHLREVSESVRWPNDDSFVAEVRQSFRQSAREAVEVGSERTHESEHQLAADTRPSRP